jgi:SAM-dependent methyltransferase
MATAMSADGDPGRDNATTSYRDFLARHETAHPFDFNNRLQLFVDAYRSHRATLGRPADILDIGCGRQPELLTHIDPADHYHGLDFYDPSTVSMPAYTQLDLNSESLVEALGKGSFDVVFCGEVLEHLFAPDTLLGQIHETLRDDGILVVSTPNLAYWRNRILLVFGISPLYLENAVEMKLGRRFRALGQGNPTEGHVKVFTYRALRDVLALKAFDIVGVTSTVTWPNRLDRLAGRLSRSLAANNVIVARRSAGG